MDLNYFLKYQETLSEIPKIAELIQFSNLPTSRVIRVHILRTFPFEFVSNYMTYLTKLWNCQMSVSYSNYDATLSRLDENIHADIFIFAIDWRLYKQLEPYGAVNWLKERINEMRKFISKPILINSWPDKENWDQAMFVADLQEEFKYLEINYHLVNMISDINDCYLIDLASVSNIDRRVDFFDERNDHLTGFPFSSPATAAIAKHISLQLLPSILNSKIKALVLDLDGTLYEGVVGEDGVHGITITSAHKRLQLLIKKLRMNGILLAICSKNDPDLIVHLFEENKELILNIDDFSVVRVNWNKKSDNIAEILSLFNIDPSAVLYIDDSIVELSEVSSILPTLNLIQASNDANITIKRMSFYPGMYQLSASGMSYKTREQDIIAQNMRKEMQKSSNSSLEYLTKLETRISISYNEKKHTRRYQELGMKTNQFNLNFERLNQVEVECRFNDINYLMITASLQDILSDSGIIGGMACSLEKGYAKLTEMFISCRALGRGVETILLKELLQLLKDRGYSTFSVQYKEADRNEPAILWVRHFFDDVNKEYEIIDIISKIDVSNYPIIVEVHNETF